MITEIFTALFKAGLPIAVASYLLVWWALKHQYFGTVDDIRMLEKNAKIMSKTRAKNKKNKSGSSDENLNVHKMNPLHNKWLSFGGGFYGVVGLLTYAVVELREIRDFLLNFGGLATLISDITPGLLINLLIDSVINFVVAIAWPIYWMSDIQTDRIWIWFAVANLSYWAGTRYALHQAGHNS
jgi:hypothetical protein